MESNTLDVEAELFKILQEEIWKELEAETGQTKEMLDAKIIKSILEKANKK